MASREDEGKEKLEDPGTLESSAMMKLAIQYDVRTIRYTKIALDD